MVTHGHTHECDKGFTLIELLVVIVIIGILVAIAIPVFLNQREKGVDASLKSDLKNAASAAETYSTTEPTGQTMSLTDLTDNGFVGSPGNTVSVAGGPAVGYCLSAYNNGASESKDATTAMTYDSLAGGLGMTGGACTGSNGGDDQDPVYMDLTAVSPANGWIPGETVTLTGANFDRAVRVSIYPVGIYEQPTDIGGFTVVSPTEITFTVPSSATASGGYYTQVWDATGGGVEM